MYIARAIEPVLQRLLRGQRASGVILTGIVGCGKTTAIESCLRQFKDTHAVFTFTGDDANFRTEVSKSTNHILSQVRTATTRQALVFVDEVQKSEFVNILQEIPLKSQLGYFKPYYVDESNKTRFGVGEIDFIAQFGKRMIPIEVKSTRNIASIDTSLMQDFIKKHRVPYGIVVYGGVPYFEKAKRLLYWPFWLI